MRVSIVGSSADKQACAKTDVVLPNSYPRDRDA